METRIRLVHPVESVVVCAVSVNKMSAAAAARSLSGGKRKVTNNARQCSIIAKADRYFVIILSNFNFFYLIIFL